MERQHLASTQLEHWEIWEQLLMENKLELLVLCQLMKAQKSMKFLKNLYLITTSFLVLLLTSLGNKIYIK